MKNNIKALTIIVVGLSAISIFVWIMSTSIPRKVTKDDPPSEVETRYDRMDQMNTIRNKAAVRYALMGVLTQFTLEDLTNANIMIDYRKADKSIEYIHVRLRDATLIPIGYYDDNGYFVSTLKKKEIKDDNKKED